ncbi:glycosyltransferase 8 domain-containing protein 2-like [Pomacea canaliculata]|uniref:glycosyltransferase 8 domain-containing protein 2-like n=1 Tax=Pomacea canaliculata TaxID=400727 RepID=UPI000D734B80|nr:glycosyltransferase 8 domain-containing protein 2-like [Pomacea canaliculata]
MLCRYVSMHNPISSVPPILADNCKNIHTTSPPFKVQCTFYHLSNPGNMYSRMRTVRWILVLATAFCVLLTVHIYREKPQCTRTVSTPQGMDSTYRRLVDLDTVHVAIFADEKLFPGVVTLTNSIVSNTASPVTFHFVTFPSNATRLRLWITGSKLRNITFEIVELPINALEGKYRSRSPRKELSSPLNFARFYLQSLFPTVGKIIYIDSDCLVLGNIKELYNIQLSSDHPVSLLRICDLRRDKFSDIKNLLNFSNPDVIKASISSDAASSTMGLCR